MIWLQDYIRNPKDATVLITTHAKDFGDAVAEELIGLLHGTLETFRGNLSLYERERYKKARYLTKMKDAQDKQKKHTKNSVADTMKSARDKGDDKKPKQAASRKKLDERMGIKSDSREDVSRSTAIWLAITSEIERRWRCRLLIHKSGWHWHRRRTADARHEVSMVLGEPGESVLCVPRLQERSYPNRHRVDLFILDEVTTDREGKVYGLFEGRLKKLEAAQKAGGGIEDGIEGYQQEPGQ
ncbi:ABC transporter [Paraphaeosphaeria minitans]|uniref:ABC transporter n=1 Tax=Paraphaeosphaeria minitans TaxID=565426 RepID=A0A9P6G8C1_9PLEO|nr:ABC transporter [Paraphaeosphaeria minitans]